MTVPIFWGIYFYSYDFMKDRIARDNYFSSPVASHILSAVSAGAIGDVITNPMWVIRTRVQTLVLHHAISSKKHSMTTLDMARTIYQEEGFFAFYKGLGASFLGLSHIAVQFPLCEYFISVCIVRLEHRPVITHIFLTISILFVRRALEDVGQKSSRRGRRIGECEDNSIQFPNQGAQSHAMLLSRMPRH